MALATPSSVPPLALPILSAQRLSGLVVLASECRGPLSLLPLTTPPTIDSTNTSLIGTEVPAMCILGEWGGSGLARASFS